MMPARFRGAIVVVWLLVLVSGVRAATDEGTVRALADRVAKGQLGAERELIDALTRPLDELFDGLEQRPLDEQERVYAAAQRVFGTVHYRLYRASLAKTDRVALDRAHASDPVLIENLFHADPRVRSAALDRVPPRPNSMAGLLIAAKVHDWDADVADRALELARRLSSDPALQRGLSHFAQEALKILRSPERIGANPDVAIVYADFLNRATAIVSISASEAQAPLLAETLETLGQPTFRPFFHDILAVVDRLGEVGDETVAPLLLAFLDDPQPRLLSRPAGKAPITQTVGDAALLALLRIYELDPEPLGFAPANAPDAPRGFDDDGKRQKAHFAFRAWMERNASLPRDERAPLMIPQVIPNPGRERE